MQNWKKTSLITMLTLVVVLVGALYVFKINVSLPSHKVVFSPALDQDHNDLELLGEQPKNIIVFIADGMGFGHLTLAMHTQQTATTPSIWQSFEVKGWHDARSNYGPLTDSEAAATAMSTGIATQFGYIGIDQAGQSVQNIFEVAAANQYATGVVTDSYVWDGTPAGFVAHSRHEDDARDLLTQIANSQLDLIFGELEDLGEGDVPEKDETIEIMSQRFQLLDKSLALPSDPSQSGPVAVLFAEDEIQDLDSKPNLTELTDVALTYLSAKNKPFLLLVESEELDSASHTNDASRVIGGLKSIQDALSLVLEFAKNNGDTLVVFTSDHETGGLAVLADYDDYPDMHLRWSTKGHSAAVVPLFAQGPGAELFSQVGRNKEIGVILKYLLQIKVMDDVDER